MDRAAYYALDNARWLLSEEDGGSPSIDDGQRLEVAQELAEQVQALRPRLTMPEYMTKGYALLRDGRYESGDEVHIQRGLDLLREALKCFQKGGAPKTAKRVAFALSSAKGAARNAGYRRSRWEQGRAPRNRKEVRRG